MSSAAVIPPAEQQFSAGGACLALQLRRVPC